MKYVLFHESADDVADGVIRNWDIREWLEAIATP